MIDRSHFTRDLLFSNQSDDREGNGTRAEEQGQTVKYIGSGGGEMEPAYLCDAKSMSVEMDCIVGDLLLEDWDQTKTWCCLFAVHVPARRNASE